MFGNEYTGYTKYRCFDEVVNLCKEYSARRPLATYAMNVYFGVAIYDAEGSEIVAAWIHGESASNFHRHKVYCTASGREYIRKGSLRFYLDDFMKVA